MSPPHLSSAPASCSALSLGARRPLRTWTTGGIRRGEPSRLGHLRRQAVGVPSHLLQAPAYFCHRDGDRRPSPDSDDERHLLQKILHDPGTSGGRPRVPPLVCLAPLRPVCRLRSRSGKRHRPYRMTLVVDPGRVNVTITLLLSAFGLQPPTHTGARRLALALGDEWQPPSEPPRPRHPGGRP